MTWFSDNHPRPGSVDWAARRILRLLDREEEEAEELRRLQAEGWRPALVPHPNEPDDGPVFGDGRDAIADLVQAELDHKQAFLNEARRRIDERRSRNRQTPRPIEDGSGPPVAGHGSDARAIGGLLDDGNPEPNGAPGRTPHGIARPGFLSGPHSDPRFQQVKYQPPLTAPGGTAPNIGGGIGIHGAGVVGGGPGGIGPSLTLDQILALFGFGTAGAVAAEEARRRLGQGGPPAPLPGYGPSVPPHTPTGPGPLGGSPSGPHDSGRLEHLPSRLPGGIPGHPGDPEPPRDRHPERPKPPALQAYPGLAEWIEQEGLILQNSKGDPQTQADNDHIIDLILTGLRARGVVAEHARGGSKEKEMYYPGPNNERKGSGRTDGQIKAGDTGEPWDFNTTDMLKDRKTPTARERRAIEKIRRLKEVHYEGQRGYFDAFPKSRGWEHGEWRRAMAEAIEELLDARFGPRGR